MNRHLYHSLLIVGGIVGVILWAGLVGFVLNLTGFSQDTKDALAVVLGFPGGAVFGLGILYFWDDGWS